MDTLTQKLTVLIAVLELLVALLRLIDLLSNGQIETHLRGNTVSPFKKAILVILQVACAATLII
ncbi:TPA: hypothetical protein H7V62_001937 [Escherichia coli]|nr:hypothetical protein [Escherichia coli]HAL9556368.1 hypothetical protein [Escherichia coli]